MDIDKSIVERTFDLMKDEIGLPPQGDEVTAKMMHEQYPHITHRQWLNRLHQKVKDGLMTVRQGKGSEKVFKHVG